MTAMTAVLADLLSYAFHSYFVSAWVNGYVIGFLLSELLENKGGEEQAAYHLVCMDDSSHNRPV